MTTISSLSYFSLYSISDITSASSGAPTQCSTQNTDTGSDTFGAAFLLDIGNVTTNDDTSRDASGAVTYSASDLQKAQKSVSDTFDQLFAYLNDMVSAANNTQANNSSSTSSSTSASSATSSEEAHAGYSAHFVGDTSNIEDVLDNGGPLPQFLAKVEAEDHLNTQQSQALENIAWQFRNTDGSQDSVHQIETALDTAGIPETPVV